MFEKDMDHYTLTGFASEFRAHQQAWPENGKKRRSSYSQRVGFVDFQTQSRQSRRSQQAQKARITSQESLQNETDLFQVVRPIWVISTMIGLFPIRLNPVRAFSWAHPLNSTLPYTLLANGVVLWSATRVLIEELEFLSQQPQVGTSNALVDRHFISMISLIHVVGVYIIMPLAISEASNLRGNESLHKEIKDKFRHLPLDNKQCVTNYIVWGSVILCCILTPPLVFIWVNFICGDTNAWFKYPSHLYQVSLVFMVTAMFTATYSRVRNIAELFTKQLNTDLASGLVSIDQVVEYHYRWRLLYSLVEASVFMPKTVLSVFLQILLLLVGVTFEGLKCLYEGFVMQGSFLCSISILFSLYIVLPCDSVQRAIDTVRTDVLSQIHNCSAMWRSKGNCEMQMFVSSVSSDVPTVSLAGLWEINRRTIGSIITTVVTYLIILLQFYQSSLKPATRTNCTERTV